MGVGDGEVGLVAHPADHRNRALNDGSRQCFVVEGPEILDGAAASHKQDHVDGRLKGVQGLQGAHEFCRCAGAMHCRRRQDHRDVRHAAPQRGHHVVQCGGAQRRDEAHRARHDRQRPLALDIEEPFGLEPRLALQELLEQSALSCALQAFDHQLQIAARLVNRKAAAHLDLVAVARGKIKQAGRAPEHRAAQLARIILEREVTMSARRA